MRPSSIHFFPLARPFLFGLFLLLAVAMALVEVGVLRYAYARIGLDRRWVFLLLLVSLLGSYINLPVAALPEGRVRAYEEVAFFGVRYVVPVVERVPGTVVAVNLGGAVVPLALSLYLLARNHLGARAVVATAIVTAACYALARPVAGLGIAMPALVPPLVAAAAAILLGGRSAPVLAYIAGSIGALVGADLLHLGAARALGAPVVSIGGAGTFDGIFLTGILAVLLA
jgi:uncharacterized membrane protein